MNKERNKLKLTVDEHDALTELLINDHVNLLTDRVLDHLCEHMEERVLTFDLASNDDRKLALEKARAEGARKLQLELRTYINKFKEQTLRPKR